MNPDTPQLQTVLLRMAILLFLVVSVTTTIQSQQQKREIISSDFTKNRQNNARVNSNPQDSQTPSIRIQNTSKAGRRYRLASSSVTNAPNAVIKQLGITIWRLRPKTISDQGPTVPVKNESGSFDLVPERTEADTRFRNGDYVRLSIESPQTGYLYVINRDLFADGTTSDAILIYPWRGMFWGENRVRAGRVIDIPAQDDYPNYFTARPTRQDQVGELLTFIVTNSPLNLPASNQTVRISNDQIARWEKRWAAQSERFEMEGGAGETWTQQEQQAALRIRARQLTRDDPAPQTIYRVASSNRLAFMVNLELSYK